MQQFAADRDEHQAPTDAGSKVSNNILCTKLELWLQIGLTLAGSPDQRIIGPQAMSIVR